MIDDIETNASMNRNTSEKDLQIIEYMDEEIEALIEDDVLIEMKYETCGYEEGVPDWVL